MKPPPLPSKADSFTLIELSIVLVIIGLIVGGVLVGRDLVRTAQVMAIWDEVQEIKTAINTFKLKYNCIPGDCVNAQTFWGADAGCNGTSSNTVAKEATCNGNGDKKVGDWAVGSGGPTAARIYEYFRFWQHLANADLIQGSFSGTWGSGSSYDCSEEIHCPKSKANGSFVVWYINYPNGDGNVFPQPGGHYLFYGAPATSGPWAIGVPRDEILTPVEAKMLDDKYDDGAPGTGEITANKQGHPYTPNCVSGTDPATATYRTDLSTKECALYFKLSDSTF